MTKHPNGTLEEALIARGLVVRSLWQTKKPCQGTAWLEALMINGGYIVIVQTFERDNGWDAYLQSKCAKIDDTIAEVMKWHSSAPFSSEAKP